MTLLSSKEAHRKPIIPGGGGLLGEHCWLEVTFCGKTVAVDPWATLYANGKNGSGIDDGDIFEYKDKVKMEGEDVKYE
jgi:hypothetical protein